MAQGPQLHHNEDQDGNLRLKPLEEESHTNWGDP